MRQDLADAIDTATKLYEQLNLPRDGKDFDLIYKAAIDIHCAQLIANQVYQLERTVWSK